MSNVVVEKFKTKVGPLPIYGWVLIIVVAVVITRWYTGRSSNATTAATTAAATAADEADPSSSDTADPDTQDASLGSSVVNGTTALPTITTDIGWSAAVARELDAEGYSPGDVATALALYFGDEPMSQSQYSLMEIALEKFGPPPESQHALTLDSTLSSASTVVSPIQTTTFTPVDSTTTPTTTPSAPVTAPTTGGGIANYLASLAPVASVTAVNSGSQAIAPDGTVLFGNEITQYNTGGISAVTSSPTPAPTPITVAVQSATAKAAAAAAAQKAAATAAAQKAAATAAAQKAAATAAAQKAATTKAAIQTEQQTIATALKNLQNGTLKSIIPITTVKTTAKK